MLSSRRDLEHDIDDTIPPAGLLDSQRLFRDMTAQSLALLEVRSGDRVLDLASGMGQDTRDLADRLGALGCHHTGLVVGMEPSDRMIRWGQTEAMGQRAALDNRSHLSWVRGFAETLPFGSKSFDAVLCKGAMDHFVSPQATMQEITRILKPGGRVVLAIANFDSLSCRLGRMWDIGRKRLWRGEPPAERPYYEPPPDHLTRFGYHDILALVEPPLRITCVKGLSLLWGFPPWGPFLQGLPSRLRQIALDMAFTLGNWLPAWSDVLVVQAVNNV